MSELDGVMVVYVGATGIDGTGLTAPEKATIVADLDEVKTAVDSMKEARYDVTRFMLSGESPDLTNAFTRLNAELPGTTSYGGAEVIIPHGAWTIDADIVFAVPGVNLRGAGGYTTAIIPTSNVSNAVFTWAIPNTIYRGPQVRDLHIDMAATAVNQPDAILFESPYTSARMENILVYNLDGVQAGFKIINGVGVSPNTNESLVAINCETQADAGYSGNAWHIERLNEGTFLNCKGRGGGEGFGTSFHARDSLGLSFLNCAAAISNIGWDIDADTLDSIGILIDNPTVESVTSTVDADGNASFMVNRLALRNVRPEVAVSIGAGPITLDYTIASTLETGSITVIEAATCSQNHIFTNDRSLVTLNGANSSMVQWANGVNTAFTVSPGLEVINGNVVLEGTWNGVHRVERGYHFWVDDTGDYRMKLGAPASDLDGVVVGAQT